MTELDPSHFAAGAAYIDGRYMPVGEAAIPLTTGAIAAPT